MLITDDRMLLLVRAVLFLGFALVIVGAFMPWTALGPISASGMDGNGVLTLLLAGLGAVIAAFDRRPRGMLIAVSVAAMALVIGLVDYVDISGGPASVGTGLYLTIAGALLATAAGGLLAFNLFKRPSTQAATLREDTPRED